MFPMLAALVLVVVSLLAVVGPVLPSPPTGPGVGPNNPAFWASRLGFSEEQYAAMARLEKNTGVAQCNELRAEISRKYGLPGNTL